MKHLERLTRLELFVVIATDILIVILTSIFIYVFATTGSSFGGWVLLI